MYVCSHELPPAYVHSARVRVFGVVGRPRAWLRVQTSPYLLTLLLTYYLLTLLLTYLLTNFTTYLLNLLLTSCKLVAN